MSPSWKAAARLITPPLVLQLLRQWRRRWQRLSPPKPEWEHIPEGWAYARNHTEVKGWNVQDILETYKHKWPRFVAMVQGSGPLGMSHESELISNENIIEHNTIMTFAYALSLASRCKERLSILDWGGGIGHYFLLAQVILPDIKIAYHCKDVQVLCEYGASLFPQQHFYTDEQCFERQYDFVMASTSMHYTEDWKGLLLRLANATSSYVYVANLPTVQHVPSFVFVQRPYQYGYNTEYLGWCLNHSELLLTAANSGLCLLREFVSGHQPFIYGAPEQNVYRGYLFEKGKDSAGN